MVEPSEPFNVIVSVKELLEFFSFRLKFPQAVRCPVKVTPLLSTMVILPVSVNVAQTSSPAGKNVTWLTTVPDALTETMSAPLHGFGPSMPASKTPWVISVMVTVWPVPPGAADATADGRTSRAALEKSTRSSLLMIPPDVDPRCFARCYPPSARPEASAMGDRPNGRQLPV